MQPADALIRWAVALLTISNLPLNCAVLVLAAACTNVFNSQDVVVPMTLTRSIELPGARDGFERTRRSLPKWFKYWAFAMVPVNSVAHLMLCEHTGALALWFRWLVLSRIWRGPMLISRDWILLGNRPSAVETRNMLLEATVTPLIVASCVMYFLPDALQDAGYYAGLLLLAYASQSLGWAYVLLHWWPELLERLLELRYPLQESDSWVAEKPWSK